VTHECLAVSRSWLLVLLGIALVHRVAVAGNPPPWVEAAREQPTPAWAQGADALVLEDSEEVTVSTSGRVLTRKRWAVRVLGPTGTSAAQAYAVYLRGGYPRQVCKKLKAT